MKSKGFIFRFIIVILMFIAGAFFYSKLPEQIPIHWNYAGEADDWGAKVWANWLMPGIALLMLVLFPIFAKIDPRRKNYEGFKDVWETIQTSIILFFAYIYGVSFYMMFNPDKGDMMEKFMMTGIGILFIVLGNYMGKVRQNYFVGLKTPWALHDPEVWQKSQRFAGWFFVLGGLIMLVNAWLQLYVPIVFFVTVISMVIIPIVYSYLVSLKK